jgi:hypothetical protein
MKRVRKVRHWKEFYDITKPMRFRKVTVIKACGYDKAMPGDPVTPDLIEYLGKHRIKVWWRAEMIEWDPDFTGDKQVEFPLIKHMGWGRYKVKVNYHSDWKKFDSKAEAKAYAEGKGRHG